MAHSGKSLISVLQEFSASMGENFVLAGGLGTGLSFYGVGAVSWCFLISLRSLGLFFSCVGTEPQPRISENAVKILKS